MVFNNQAKIVAITFGFPGLPSLTSEIYCGYVIQWKLHSQWFPNLYFVSDNIKYFIDFQTWNSIWGFLTFPTPCRSYNYLSLFLSSRVAALHNDPEFLSLVNPIITQPQPPYLKSGSNNTFFEKPSVISSSLKSNFLLFKTKAQIPNIQNKKIQRKFSDFKLAPLKNTTEFLLYYLSSKWHNFSFGIYQEKSIIGTNFSVLVSYYLCSSIMNGH